MNNDARENDKERLARMVRDGVVTDEEAARLQASLDQQEARDEVLVQSMLERRSARRRFQTLIGFCVAFFLFGAVTSWFLAPVGPATSSTPIGVSGDSQSTAAKRAVDLAALSEERRRTMSQSIKLSGTVFVLIIVSVVGLILVLLYNGLVDARERVNGGWAQVENVYQRRLDLVPVLIDGVKTYMDHERETLTALTEARAEALGAQASIGGQAPQNAAQMRALEAAQGKLESALARLFAVVENYPDLKASQNFLALQDQIEGTENRIAMERRNYNEFSRYYNARIQKFPHNLMAAALGFEAKAYFKAEDEALGGLKDPFARTRQ